jgi:hypothetical protein
MSSNPISIVHDKVPNRLRIFIPFIKNKPTYAEVLRQSLLRDPVMKGIYHAVPNTVTGRVLIKFHPAHHTCDEVYDFVQSCASRLSEGEIEISLKHKNPRLGRMNPGAFFTRELIVSIAGNVIAGLVLAVFIAA